MDIMERINSFAIKWCNKFKDTRTQSRELDDCSIGDECKALGFIMDCGDAFESIYGPAVYDAKALLEIIEEVTDVFLLGSAIYSRWRYYNHWSQSSICEPESRKWFILALTRLAELSEYKKDDGNE